MTALVAPGVTAEMDPPGGAGSTPVTVRVTVPSVASSGAATTRRMAPTGRSTPVSGARTGSTTRVTGASRPVEPLVSPSGATSWFSSVPVGPPACWPAPLRFAAPPASAVPCAARGPSRVVTGPIGSAERSAGRSGRAAGAVPTIVVVRSAVAPGGATAVAGSAGAEAPPTRADVASSTGAVAVSSTSVSGVSTVALWAGAAPRSGAGGASAAWAADAESSQAAPAKPPTTRARRTIRRDAVRVVRSTPDRIMSRLPTCQLV